MKKNILKYGLILLSFFFFCTNVMSQDEDPGNGPFSPCPGESIPGGMYIRNDEGQYAVCPGPNLDWCVMEDISNVGGGCYLVQFVPLGSGIIISMIFIFSYGGYLFYRRKLVSAV